MSTPPIDPASLHRAAIAAVNRGAFDEARRLCLELVAAQPGLADAHFLLAMAEAGAGHIAAALPALETALRLSPQSEYLAQQARLLVLVRRDAEALQAADRAAALRPTTALTLDTIGCVYSRLGAHARAVPLFEAAVARQPQHTQMRYNLASSLGFLGRFDDAVAHYEQIVAAAPGFVKAHSALSALKKQTPESNHVARLEALLQTMQGRPEELHLRYALAKEYEDLKNPDAVFSNLDAANHGHKARVGYHIDFDRQNFGRIMQRFAEPSYFQGEGDTSAAPIFVMGMPRTGTTLVDRILSSHPKVESVGELNVMQIALKRLAGTPSRYALDVETIDAAGRVSPRALGERYVQGAAPYRKTSKRFLDKLPLNFLYAGYIAQALPEAKLVCLRRHPMDSVWSNYRHLFATNFSYYNYSYDLLDCAEYYLLFDRLMAYWQQRFPGRILEVRYEALVDDLEAEARKLLAHCGLDWDDACLRFHENEAAVATPSATQVRQPIYRGALGRWRSYEHYLQPVADYFAANGIAI